MKRTLGRYSIPLVLVLFAGCATQATNEPAAAQNPQPAARQPEASAVQNAPSSSTAMQAQDSAPTARSVYYDFDSSSLRPGDRKVVDGNAQYLRAHPSLKARIEGNADERGSAEYNLALGQRRAEGVMQALKLEGITDDRMEAVSYGKEKPKAQGHDEAAWSQNRRSDILYR